jgi:hypothetical protein
LLSNSAQVLIEQLLALSKLHFPTVLPLIQRVASVGTHCPSSPLVLRALDDLANGLEDLRSELRTFLGVLGQERIVSKIWTYFTAELMDESGFQLNPDDYPYQKNTCQTPFWIAMLYTKLGVSPPGHEKVICFC